MKISEVCIQRPVFAWVMTFILIALGVVGGSRLPLQKDPKIETPYLTIEASLPGAGPDIIENSVTRPIEEAVAGIDGIVSTESTSSVEDSKITLEFTPERRIDDATNDVRDRLNKAKDKFPKEMNEPNIIKARAEDRPLMTLALTSDKTSPSELGDYATNELKKEFEAIPGVARVEIAGGGLYKMYLKLDPVKLAAYNLTVADVMKAIRSQNFEKPAGQIVTAERQYLVTTLANLETPTEFENLVVSSKDKHLVRLKDIGKAEETAEDKKTRTRFNGKLGVSIGIVKQSVANPIEVTRDIKAALPRIEERLPDGVSLKVGSDKARFIEQSLHAVYWTIGEAIFLVILVVFIFLRSLRAAIIPLVTIPVSLIGALFLMYLAGFSINTFTLLSMVLAIGLVVDDAIVVLENIYRRIEDGMETFKASLIGIREISFSIIAMTLTLVAVYAPIALSKGKTGKFFTEFALTLAGAVLISGFAALTLSPMMCARMLKRDPHHNLPPTTNYQIFKAGIWLDWIEEAYTRALHSLMDVASRRMAVIFSGLAFALLGLAVYYTLPGEMFPREDQGQISIEGQASQTATLEHTDRYVNEVDAVLATYPEITRRVTSVNNPTYDIFIQLDDNRKRTTAEIENDLKIRLQGISGIDTKIETGSVSGDKSNVVQFVVQANKTYREVRELAETLSRRLHQYSFVEAILSNIHADAQDYTVAINREIVSSLNIEPETIADTIEILLRGRKTGNFKKEGRLYDVMVEVSDVNKQTPEDITNLFVKGGDKQESLVPLAELVTVHARTNPMEIYRYNRLRSVSFSLKLKPGVGLMEGITKVKESAKEILPRDARIDWTGETRRYLSESQNVVLIFVLALFFIYFVMAAQFESWIDPFIIMLSVPLSLAGAVITLALIENGSINLYSQIGFVTLIGLITKHGILMVDVANRLRDEGKERLTAIIMASRMRLRPILMTTFAMVLGAVPLALATGAGYESRRQIGWVIVGGMSVGTLFTLFVLPAFYYYLARRTRVPMKDLPE
ncbi:MAG: efflux RND transporter permease subunit [Alphaproteobacteria bacterium]|jgi:multidrug efflux pump|nr:efflux RND transporter permease subunit [Alphaproteobacteria bacterium]